VKRIATVADLRAELRRVSAQAAELTHEQKYNSGIVRLRDDLIREALNQGVRPAAVVHDTGLSRARIYQIRAEGGVPQFMADEPPL
jgi:adenine deaminase